MSVYQCPEKLLGKMVFWYPSGNVNEEPWVTFVSKVNMASLRLHVLSPAGTNFLIKDGVRHHKDGMNDAERQEFGCWETPQECSDRREANRQRQQKAREENAKAEEQAAKREKQMAGAK